MPPTRKPSSVRANPRPSPRRAIVEPLEARCVFAAGDLNPSFGGGDGVTVLDHFAKQLIESGDAFAIQPDGKMLIAGSGTDGFGRFFPDFLLVRLNADGTPDATFGTGGQVTLDFGGAYTSQEEAFAITLQPDGKIIVAGRASLTATENDPLNYDFALARFTANGSLDGSFGSGGKVRTDLGSMADAARGLALAADGSIYAVGESGGNAAVVHYTSAGVLDTNFHGDGKIVLELGGADTLRGAVVQADGKLIAAGTTGLDFAAVRITSAGTLDAGFGNSGIRLVDFGSPAEEARALALDGSGRLVLGGGARVGTTYDFALARLTPTGALDVTFGTGGKFTFNASTNSTSAALERIDGLAIQADGKIVVAGTGPDSVNRQQWEAARVTDTGTLDAGFGTSGVTHLAFAVGTSGKTAGVALSGGQLYIAGTRMMDGPLQPYSLGVMKLTTGGALDSSFSGDGLALYDALGPALNVGEVSMMLPDGRFLVAENVRLTPRNTLAGSVIRLTMFTSGGLRDATFGVGGTVQIDLGLAASEPGAITVDANGKILIAGTRYFLPDGGKVLFGEAALTRLNADGTFDTSFGTGGVVTSPDFKDGLRQETHFNGIVVQPDGKIVTLGSIATFDPLDRVVTLNRYLPNGTLDPTFAGDGRGEFPLASGSVDQFQLLPDGRFLLAGSTSDTAEMEFLRVSASGVLDSTFGQGGIAKPGLHGKVKKILLNGDGTFDAVADSLSPLPYAGFIITGVTSPAVYQFTMDGTLDPSFDHDGILNLSADLGFSEVGAVARDSSGRYLLGVSFEGLDRSTYSKFVRFNTDGSRDQTFGTDEGTDLLSSGIRVTRAAYLRLDGSVVIVGSDGVSDAYVASIVTETVAPPAGLLTFETRYSTVQESTGQAVIDVVRLGGSTGTVTVHYAITGGTASAGADYTVVSGDLTFNNGVTSQHITIPLTVDSIGEIAETIQLTLSNPSGGAVLDNPTRHQVTIAAHNGALGSVDPSFGSGGVASSDHATPNGSALDSERVNAMTYAPDGNIVVVGTSGSSPDFFLSRFHADGTPDLTFGDRGSVATDFGLSFDGAESVAVLPDGRILVAGFATSPGFSGAVHYGGDDHGLSSGLLQVMLVRYLPDGTIDRTYGQDGFVLVDPRVAFGRDSVNTETLSRDFVIQPNGEVYAGLVLRDFKADGSDGRIDAGIAHFRADGRLDMTFAGDGFAESGLIPSIFGGAAIEEQTDGKFVLAFGTGDYHGDAEEQTAVVRYTHAGTLDPTFGTGGRFQINVVTDSQSPEIVTSLALQQDGKILLGGYVDTSAAASGGYVIRLTTSGTLDTAFGTAGIASFHGLFPESGSDAKIFDLAQLPNGRIAAVGQSLSGPGVESSQSPAVVVEFSADGQLDPQFGINGAFRITAAGVSAGTLDAGLLITPANEIVVGVGGVLSTGPANNSQFVLQRFSTQGAAGRFEWSLDATSVDEADGLVGLTLKRVGGTVGSVSVDVNLVSGTAIAGLDFFNVGTTVTFLDGQTTLEILVPITRGDALENTETFSAVISNPTGGASIGAVSTETVSIVDGPDRFEFSSPVFNFIEGNQFVSVDVVRKGGAVNAVSVDYALHGVEATNGLDFDALENGTLKFATGQTMARITFALKADNLVEGREGIDLALLNPRGGPILGNVATARVNIYDLSPGKGLNSGALDANFGNKGTTSDDVFAGSASEQARDMVALPDGKFIVVGETGGSSSDFLIARYLPNGALDPSFGVGGLVTTDFFGGADSARSVALDAQGRVVVAGWALRGGTGDFAVARYLPNGTLDPTFDTDGRATVDFGGLDDRGSSLALGADSRIIVGGWTAGVQSCDIAVAVLTENGALDPTFSKDGLVTLDVRGNQDLGNAILVEPDGAIVVGGTSSRLSSVLANTTKDFVVVRFTAAGVLDATFSKDGYLFGPDDAPTGTSNSALNALVLRDDGHILFGGSLGGNILFGDLDATGGIRFYATDNFTSLQLGGSGSGSSSQAINDLVIAPDGKIVATGQITFIGDTAPHLFVKRYLPDFTLDVNFGLSSSTIISSLGAGRAVALAKDSGILAVANGFATVDLLSKSATPKEGAFSLDALSYAIAENGGSVTVTVNRPHEASHGNVTVDYALVGLSALPGQDFTPVAGTLVFRETETTKTFTIPIINDVFKEGTESLGIVLSNPTGGAQLSSAAYAPVFILDNDTAPPPASFQLDTSSFLNFVTEGFTFLTIQRTGNNLGAVTVDYHTEDGTAKAGEDYIASFGTLSFAAGETSKQITILGISDDRIEGPETFFLKFTTPTGGSTLDLGLATITLTIPDSVPSETFTYAGRLDTTFDTDGRVSTDSGVTGPDNFFALAQGADGKTVAVGQAGQSGGFFLARYNADGSLDTSFGTGGKTVTSLGSDFYETAIGVRIQPDGKILVIGTSAADQIHEEIVLARYTKTGELDKSFGKQGLARTPLLNIAALSFVQGTAGDVTVTPDGKFALTAITRNGLDLDVSVLRFLPTGQLDSSFGVGGAVTFDRGLSDDRPAGITAQPDGKLIVTFTDGLTRAVRLNPNGSVDKAFGMNGTVSANPTATLLSPALVYDDHSTIQESLVLPNGDILLIGQAFGSGKPPGSPLHFTEALHGGVLMLRYHADGTPVAGFGTGGIVEVQGTSASSIQDVQFDEAGKIDILTPSTLIRVLADGRADPGFGVNGTTNTSGSSALLIQPDGHILVAGGSAFSNGDATLSRYVGGPVAGALRLNVLTEKVSETGGMLIIPVERIAGVDGPVGVTISTASGTATAGSDFTAVSQTLSWADGELGVKTITVPILDDLLADAGETFTINLSNPTGGAVLSTRKTETVTIVDDDQPGIFEFSTAEFTAHENDATGLLTVTRQDGHVGAVSVHYSVTGGTAVAGLNFNLATGTLNFADGEISKTISVSLLDDLLLSEDKTVVVTLDTPSGGATLGSVPAARLTIVDNEVPKGGQFTLSSPDFEVREDGGGYLVTVLRVGGSDGAASVKLSAAPGTARSGLDFLPFDVTLQFDPGQTSSSIFIPVFDNADVNSERTVLVSLSEPTGSVVLTTNTAPTLGTSFATLHITDNDAFPVRLTPGSLGFQTGTLTVSEGAGRVPIVVFRDEGSAGAVSVMLHINPGTAESGRDLTAGSVLVEFADSEISKTIMVPLRNDFINESTETFTVTLDTVTGGAVLGALDSTTVNIADDDSSPLPDFNNDGYADLILLKAGKLYVHLNSAGGPGQPVYSAEANSVISSVKSPTGFVFGDFNQDGNTDLALLAVKTKSIFILPGHGDGTFGAPIAFASGPAKQPSIKGLLTADFNGDGQLDFVAQQARGINLILNTSEGGSFSFGAANLVVANKGLANLTAADFNEDGHTDLFVTKGGPKPTANVYTGQGDGTFHSMLVSRLPKGMKAFNVVDLNTDGHLDLVGIFPKNNVGLLAGAGTGLFGGGTGTAAGKPLLIPTAKGPASLAVGDFDDDLSRDLLTISAKKIANILVRNGSAFTVSGTAATLFAPTGLAVVDVNRDGDMDLVLFNKKNQFKVLTGGAGASFTA